jgi:alpha-tubulin suppressor-like RCC1 family protein
MLPVFGLMLTVVMGMATLSVDSTTNFGWVAAQQSVAEQSALAAAQLWASEVVANGYTASTLPAPAKADPAMTLAGRLASVNNFQLNLNQTPDNSCDYSTASQIDVLYSNLNSGFSLTCGSAMPPTVVGGNGSGYRHMEISIPPIDGAPADCVPTYYCVEVDIGRGIFQTFHGGTYNQARSSQTITARSIALAPIVAGSGGAAANYGLYGWGDNTNLELGIGGSMPAANPKVQTPTLVSGVGAVTLAPGEEDTSKFLRSDGTVWQAGLNANGQVGQGQKTTTNYGTFQQVCKTGTGPACTTFLTGIRELAGAHDSSSAIDDAGHLWTWGANLYGNACNGSTASGLSLPVEAKDKPGTGFLNNVVHVAKTGHTQYVTTADGKVWACGDQGDSGTTCYSVLPNGCGGLGNTTVAGGGVHQTLPLEVMAVGGGAGTQLGSAIPAIAVAGGLNFGNALLGNGQVAAWGADDAYQLGDNTTGAVGCSCQVTPVMVQKSTGGNLTNVKQVMSGDRYTLALLGNGTVVSWGYNGSHQACTATSGAIHLATPIAGLTNVKEVATGAATSDFLKDDGTVWACGRNDFGEIGTTGQAVLTDAQALTQVCLVYSAGSCTTPLTGVVHISASAEHAFAVVNPPGVVAWGFNGDSTTGPGKAGFGDVGDGTTASKLVPANVSTLTDVIAIAGGWDHTLAVDSQGGVWSWGENLNGALGTTAVAVGSYSAVPVKVMDVGGAAGSQLTHVIAVGAGRGHSLALKSDGTVFAWGGNSAGQLGDNTTTQRTTPVATTMTSLGSATHLSAGETHSLATNTAGQVYAWGTGTDLELGQGAATGSLHVPTLVTGLASEYATNVAGASTHSAAVMADGTAWAWGDNTRGELANNTITSSGTPIEMLTAAATPLANASMGIAAEEDDTIVLAADGNVWGVGHNAYGEIGDNTTTEHHFLTLAVATSMTGATAISQDGDSTLAINSDGAVYAFGFNQTASITGGSAANGGELGDNTTVKKMVPTQVHGVGNTGMLAGAHLISGGGFHSMAVVDGGGTGGGVSSAPTVSGVATLVGM